MDGCGKDQFEKEKGNEDPNNYNSGSMSSDWRFCQPNLSSAPLDLVTSSGNQAPFCKEDLMRSSVSMVDSINTAVWENPNNLQNVGYSDINVQNNLSTLNTLGILNGNPASLRSGGVDRTHDMGWNPRMPMVKGSTHLPNLSGTIPESLSQFPVDSGLIERAARFSCFNSGNFTDMLNPFGAADTIGLYARVEGLMPGPQEVLSGNFVKPVHYMQQHNRELDGVGASKDIPVSVKHGTSEASPQKNERKEVSLVTSQDKEKDCSNRLGNGADEAELSGDVRGSGHDDPSMLETTGGETSCKGLVSKKRRRGDEDADLDKGKRVAQASEIDKDDEAQKKVNQAPDSLANKGSGKNNKQGSQASDPPKEEYIHVRARRGQATNSHSLAERVRREKISERMKFLQDLVPGCSKVTGKAVMLDEIINYVQSLQRQVEFLSMKLATVNPRVDFNIEGLLAKDMLQSRAGPSSTLGFPPDMPMAYPPMHIPQPGLIQPGIPGMAGPDLLRRIGHNSLMAPMTGGLKEHAQLPNHWEDELNNVVQMGFSNGATSSSQDVDGPLPQGHMKVEL